MKDGKIIYNNLQSLNDIERKAIDIYENGTRKEFRDFFEENFEDEYDSFKAFKTDLFTKAKGYTKIENKVFSDALDEAFKQSSVYDVETYRKSKEIANKYFAHLGRTKESQNMILDYIANDIDIDSDKLLKANAKYFEEKSVNHGLYAFPDDMYTVKGSTNNPLKRIDDNIRDIIKDKQMEISLSSSEYMIGPIGVTGKTSPIAYHTNDIRSHLEFSFDGGKRVYQQNNKRGTGTVQDIIDSLEQESTVDLFSRHDELIGKGLDVESLWVKEDFYTQNKDYVHELMQKYNINNLDLIHASENTEKIIPSQIERVNVNNINLKNNKSITNKNIRQELLELVSQTRSHAVNEADSKIANFLNGEISLSQEELETIKNEFTDRWFNTASSKKRKLKEYEHYSFKEYCNLPDDEYDDDIAEKLLDKVSNRKDLTKTFDITKDKQLYFDKQWKKDDVFKFSNGTSETRARLFLSEGKGYTSLQTPAFVEGETYLSRTGLQISMQGTDFESRSPGYAKAQSSRFKDRPVIIEGEIPAQYVYANQTRGGEFGIPHQYYDKISSAKILDAETRRELYHLENGKLVKSDSFIEAKLPELKIKKENNIKPKLTPQEAFDKYGPNDDKFYTSQGLDPKEQKEAINKLNSKRKPPEPLPDYSADDARLDKMFAEDKANIESLKKQRKRPNYKPVEDPKLKKKNNNIIDKIFEFEDKYSSQNYINFNNKNIKQEFEKLSKGHVKLYSELLYRPEEYRQELSKYYEALKSDVRPLHEIPKIIGNDIEPIMSVQNIFAQEHGFESYNDILKYTLEHFDEKSPIPIKKVLELKNNVKTEIPEPKPKETVKQDKNLDKLYQDKIDWINQHHPDLVESNEAKVKLYDYINDKSKKISFDDIIRANASAHVNDTVYHGMGNPPFQKLSEKEAFELIDKGDIAIADSSLDNIIKNKSIELSVSNKPIFGDIGIKGKADIVGYFKSDIGSSVDADGTRHTSRKDNSKLLNDIISGKHKPSSYHEGIARDFNIESLWVKKDFYEKNKDQVYFLLKKHNIQQLDIIEDFEKGQIQTLYTKDLKKYFNDNVPISKQNKNLEKATNEVQDNFTENINNTPKPKVENTTKPSKNIVKPTKNTSKMTTKSLGRAGKSAIGLIVAGITGLAIGKALSSDEKDKKQDKQVAKQQNISYNNQYIDNQYAMQMAQDISSYRYGKHMTGFVNF